MSIPQLIYHTPLTTLYPTNSVYNLLVVRLSSPVRMVSVRIIPEGVESFNGPGKTDSATWDGELFFHISPSDPVNALVSTCISVYPAEHALDFPLDMPEGVSTRLMILRAPVKVISLSIYGYTGGQVEHDVATPMIESTTSAPGVDDWRGSTIDLLAIVGNPASPTHLRELAFQSLELSLQIQPSRLTSILNDDSALQTTLSSSSLAATGIRHSLFADANTALHLAVRNFLPSDHPLYHLARLEGDEALSFAWSNLDLGLGSLRVIENGISRNPGTLLETNQIKRRGNFMEILSRAQKYAMEKEEEAKRSLECCIKILSFCPDEHLVLHHLARKLPRLVVIAQTRSCDVSLKAFSGYNVRTVLEGLAESAVEVIEGRSCYETARRLAEPYLDQLTRSDPIRTFFDKEAFSTHLSPSLYDDTPDGRALHRLDQTLKTTHPSLHPTPSSSLLHTLPAQSLLSIVAPVLLQTLQRAPHPPLGIVSTLPIATPDSGNQASAWAGKVYTSHEFRSRENTGLGIQGIGASPGNNVLNLAGSGGGGLGAGGRAARPASRHVDELR